MSFGKSKSKTANTQSATSSLTDWSKGQWDTQTGGILDATAKYTSQPYEKYTGQMTAGMTPEMLKAREVANGSVGNWQGLLSDAETAAKAGGEGILGPQAVDYRTYNEGDEARFMNPYQKAVVDSSGAYYDEQLARQLNEQRDASTMRGAFGNVSNDLGEAELRRGATMDRAKAMADLNYQGFNDSMDRYERESGNLYNAGTRNSDAVTDVNKFNSGQKLNSAGILGSLAGQKQGLAANDVQMLESLGANSREIEQAKLDAERGEFDKEAADRLQKFLIDLQTRQGILNATPKLLSTSGSSTGTNSESGFKLDLADMIKSLGDAAKGGATAAASDRRLKRDIRFIGLRNGHRWYCYRYLWDKSGTVREGVMAQEVLLSAPAAVIRHWTGFFLVNYGALGLAHVNSTRRSIVEELSSN